MTNYELSDSAKLEIVDNRLHQLHSSKYDLQLNLATAERAGNGDAVVELKKQLEDYDVAIEIHDVERNRLLNILGSQPDTEEE